MGFLAVLFWFAIGVLTYRFEVRYWDDGTLSSVFGWIGLFLTCFYIANLQLKKSREINEREWAIWLDTVDRPKWISWKKQNRSKWQKFWYWAFFIK